MGADKPRAEKFIESSLVAVFMTSTAWIVGLQFTEYHYCGL
jgi:hypothetical protein